MDHQAPGPGVVADNLVAGGNRAVKFPVSNSASSAIVALKDAHRGGVVTNWGAFATRDAAVQAIPEPIAVADRNHL